MGKAILLAKPQFGPPCPWIGEEGFREWQDQFGAYTDADWAQYHGSVAEFRAAVEAYRALRV
ncbi:hypothetical protein J2X36_002136 [Methylobacterium sp. BE186]|nr:hypothetical protein [Methylobacterium sp. BE186]